MDGSKWSPKMEWTQYDKQTSATSPEERSGKLDLTPRYSHESDPEGGLFLQSGYLKNCILMRDTRGKVVGSSGLRT